AQATRAPGLQENHAVEDIKVIGLRRRIAEKMALSKSRIPHITYVEEVDVSALEDLRAALNKGKRTDQPKLTMLPFLMRAMVKAIADQPGLN
uniref:2-oxo acid dehydrogenase subunit E2 n=1 Tax=Enterobacter cloacae TaxID=550 RepID=UPI001954C7AF